MLLLCHSHVHLKPAISSVQYFSIDVVDGESVGFKSEACGGFRSFVTVWRIHNSGWLGLVSLARWSHGYGLDGGSDARVGRADALVGH